MEGVLGVRHIESLDPLDSSLWPPRNLVSALISVLSNVCGGSQLELLSATPRLVEVLSNQLLLCRQPHIYRNALTFEALLRSKCVSLPRL